MNEVACHRTERRGSVHPISDLELTQKAEGMRNQNVTYVQYDPPCSFRNMQA